MNTEFLSYLETARQKVAQVTGVPSISDRQLSEMLGLNPSAVNQWRKRGTYPTDETMIQIAVLANKNEAAALMALNEWRSEGDAAKQSYKILKRLVGSIDLDKNGFNYSNLLRSLILTVATTTIINSSPVHASENENNLSMNASKHSVSDYIYYHIFI